MVRLALAALLATALSCCAAYRPGDEVCVLSPDNSCGVDELKAAADGSTLVYPGGKTRCAFDDYSDPAGNFSTNATFFFQVFPNEKKDKSKVLLYLQGGGACIDDSTCNFALQCSSPSSTFQPNARALSVGVLNRSEPANLFNDWNIVHVPYCTGDIHLGNRTVEPTQQGWEIIFGQPQCLDKNVSTHLNGFENSLSAFKWALANFPEPEHLVISGSSAGALGAQLLGKFVADMWKVEEKKIRYSVVADSYVGVVPDDRPAGELIKYYGSCSLPYGLNADLVSKCDKGTATVTEVMSSIIEETPFTDWFFIDSKADKTQRFFYELFRQGILGFPFKDLLSPEEFFSNVTEILDAYRKESSRVATFFVEGDHHVFFNLDDWFTTQRAQTNETLGDVMRDILAGNYTGSSGSTVGSSGGKETVPSPADSSADVSVASGIALLNACVIALVAVLAL